MGLMRNHAKLIAVAAATLLIVVLSGPDAEAEADWSAVAGILGQEGRLNSDGSYKVVLLRTDVAVKSGLGMPTPAELGLNSYAAFVGTPEKATVVGDTCMLEHEVNAVIDALRAGAIEVVALHNHMLTDEPRLFFMHFQGRGDASALARTVRKAWEQLGGPRPAAPTPDAEAREPDWKAVSAALGREGHSPRKGVWKFSFPRKDLTITLDGQRLVPGVGLGCWAAFYACPCGLTKVMGDTCVRRPELQGAIDALRKGGIHISAIHNHLLGSSEPVMFMHIEAEGDAVQIARTIRNAWDGLGR